jgi:hypothetical protein
MIRRRMRTQESERSPDLDQLRLMLFPHLSREDGWRRIETAFERAADRERSSRIEQLASNPDLAKEMLRRLRGLGGDDLA